MSVTTRDPNAEALIEAGARLSPWAYEIAVRDGVTTSDFNARSNPALGQLGVVGFSSPEERFKAMLLRLFPDGLEGRSVLDCACNSGAYLFWAKRRARAGASASTHASTGSSRPVSSRNTARAPRRT